MLAFYLFIYFFPTGSIYTKWQEIKNTAPHALLVKMRNLLGDVLSKHHASDRIRIIFLT